MDDIYEEVRELMGKLTYADVIEHLYLFALHQGKNEELTEHCPYFYECGFDWIFIVDLSEIIEENFDLGIVTNELARKWLQVPEDEILQELQKYAYANMSLRTADHLKIRVFLDDNNWEEAVPVYEISLNDMNSLEKYTNAFIMSDDFLYETHKKIGDFFLFPRYRDRFFVIPDKALKDHDRKALESYYRVLLKYGFLRKPLYDIFSDKILYCDDHTLRAYT